MIKWPDIKFNPRGNPYGTRRGGIPGYDPEEIVERSGVRGAGGSSGGGGGPGGRPIPEEIFSYMPNMGSAITMAAMQNTGYGGPTTLPALSGPFAGTDGGQQQGSGRNWADIFSAIAGVGSAAAQGYGVYQQHKERARQSDEEQRRYEQEQEERRKRAQLLSPYLKQFLNREVPEIVPPRPPKE